MNETILNKQKEILNNLNPQERELALKILSEYKEKGNSKTYQDLLYEDYKEIPVDINTFIDNENYLKYAWYDSEDNCKIYPYWREKLNKIFPNNIDTNYNDLIFSGARGLGKSEIAVLIACYLMYRIMCLKKPLEYFHMKPTEKFCFAFMNIKIDDAEEIANSKFQNTVKMSPWFLSHGTLGGRSNQYWIPPEYIDIIVGSQSSDVIGKPIFYGFFDEISFIRNQNIDIQKKKAIDMIDTAIGGMLTRFIYKGKNPTLLILASSKRSEKSFLEEHMKKVLNDKDAKALIIDEAVWNVKPPGTYSDKTFPVAVGNKFLVSQIIEEKEVDLFKSKGYKIIWPPIDLKSQFNKDIDRALCDFAGISSTELSKYISGNIINECVNDKLTNPFIKEIIEVGNGLDDLAEYKNFFDIDKIPKEMMSKPLFVHLDMSISGDMTGIAGVWIKGKKPTTDGNPGKDLSFQLAFGVSIKAPKGRQISFEKNRNFIRWLKEVGFKIKKVTSDTFQSYDLQQQLKAEGFDCDILSVDRVDTDRVCKPYQYLKSTLYEKRIELFPDQELVSELADLERNINTGKIDHPLNGKKDIADAVCGATFTASRFAEEYAYDYGENLETTLEVNKEQSTNDKQQLIVDMENELKQMNNILNNPFGSSNQDMYGNTYDDNEDFYNPFDDIIVY